MQTSEQLRETLVALGSANEQLRKEAAQATLLLGALESLLRIGADDDPFSTVFASLQSVFAFDRAMVLAETGETSLEVIAAAPPALMGLRWRLGPFLRRVVAGRVSVTFSNCALEEWRDVPPDLLSPDQPALYLPMRVRDRRGVLMLLRDAGRPGFDRSHVALARKFAVLASHALAARQATQSEAESQRLRHLTDQLRRSEQNAQRNAEELARRAYFDDLTGLPNRARLQDEVERILSAGGANSRLALVFIDLDNFKHINDYYSHAVGDAVLVAVARRIAGRIRASDMLARVSGDEFMLLINPVTEEAELRAIVQELLDDLRQPFRIENFECFTSASFGVSLYPEHGSDYEALRRNADSAMYRAKGDAKGEATFFDASMGQAVTARMELEQRLRLAIRDGRFRCALQPKVDFRSRRVVGFEALVRWRDESGVIQAPGKFVGIAAELGLLDHITRSVLGHAIDALDPLDRNFGGGTTISINVAAKQVADLRFMRSFVRAIAATGQADRFMLEVTEDAFVAAGHFQAQVLPLLREVGVRVSIDDFGTGYSSLSALSDITADEIKVDRSFITAIHQRPRSQSVLKAIESLSHALGMTVVAEGVETAEELLYLSAATGLRFAQGYYFAKPMFVEDLIRSDINPTRDMPARLPAAAMA